MRIPAFLVLLLLAVTGCQVLFRYVFGVSSVCEYYTAKYDHTMLYRSAFKCIRTEPACAA